MRVIAEYDGTHEVNRALARWHRRIRSRANGRCRPHLSETTREITTVQKTGVNSMAVPKSMACRRSASRYEGSHAKVRQWTKSPVGNQPANAFGVLLRQHPGAGVVARKGNVDNIMCVDRAFTTGARTWCIRTDKSNGRCVRPGLKRKRAENRRFGVPSLRPPGMHGRQSYSKWRRQQLDGTLLSDDITRDGIGTRIPLSI
jgi:hypothetical protein